MSNGLTMPLPIFILTRSAVLDFAFIDLRFRDRHHSRGQLSELLKWRFLALLFRLRHQSRICPRRGLRKPRHRGRPV